MKKNELIKYSHLLNTNEKAKKIKEKAKESSELGAST